MSIIIEFLGNLVKLSNFYFWLNFLLRCLIHKSIWALEKILQFSEFKEKSLEKKKAKLVPTLKQNKEKKAAKKDKADGIRPGIRTNVARGVLYA